MLAELQWKKIKVLDDGFVCLVDVMGNDASVVQAARVSYGKDARDDRERQLAALVKLYGKDGAEGPVGHGMEEGFVRQWSQEQWAAAAEEVRKDERTLIRYLMRHRHTTPFEMVEVKLLIRVPMDCWRQWIRHRTASVNEYSTRYTEAIDSRQTTDPDQWRLQSSSNKQGSSGFINPGEPGELGLEPSGVLTGRGLTAEEQELHLHADEVYKRRLASGVAKEQARKDLPLSTYTEAYWKIDLHNLFHFLSLRMDSHAQKEIRDYATVIGEQIIKPLFPLCWEAFEDYRLGATHLSRLDGDVIKSLMLLVPDGQGGLYTPDQFLQAQHASWSGLKQCRERDECLSKLQRLGIVQC